MAAIDLSPMERGALLVLMAEARPLKERAELKAVHGITLSAGHRQKLQRLGLIKTSEKPYTRNLTEKGWEWASGEIAASKAGGTLGDGPFLCRFARPPPASRGAGGYASRLFLRLACQSAGNSHAAGGLE